MGKGGLSARLVVYILVNAIVILLGIIAVMGGNTEPHIDPATSRPIPQEWWRDWLTAIGFGLIATGIAGLVIFLWVYLSDRWFDRIERFDQFGLIGVHAERGPQLRMEYEDRLNRARKSIDVLGFGLRSLREDFHADFERWAVSAKVRILLIDPDFPGAGHTYAEQRDREENDKPGAIASHVSEFARAASKVAAAYPDRFQVKVYRCLPAVTIFRVDNEMYWGPYLMRTPSRNLPVFVVRKHGIIFQRLANHFDQIWNDPTLSVALVPNEKVEVKEKEVKVDPGGEAAQATPSGKAATGEPR